MSPHITSNRDIRGGKPCIAGTRFSVRNVLEYTTGGNSIETLVAEFPFLTPENIDGAITDADEHNILISGACSIASILTLFENNMDQIEAEAAAGAQLIIIE